MNDSQALFNEAWMSASIKTSETSSNSEPVDRWIFKLGWDARDPEIKTLELALASQGVDYGSEMKRLELAFHDLNSLVEKHEEGRAQVDVEANRLREKIAELEAALEEIGKL